MKENRLYEGKLVEFHATDGAVLNGFLIRPKRARICVIYIHGLLGNFYSWKMPFLLANMISKYNVGLLTMNTRGHDMAARVYRFKSGKKDRLLAGAGYEKFEDSEYDVDGAIVFLKTLGFKKVILVGYCTGCQKVVYYQSKIQQKDVLGLILMAPTDNYDLFQKKLGKNFNAAIDLAKHMVKTGKGNSVNAMIPKHLSAKRFLSMVDTKNVEAQLLDYDGELKAFSRIKTPILTLFGSQDLYVKGWIKERIGLLEKKTKSNHFSATIVKNAQHNFIGYEGKVAKRIADFVLQIKNKQHENVRMTE